MSRFFAASSSSSDGSDSSLSSNSDSDSELLKVIEEQKQSTTKYTRNQYSSDSESDSQKKLVISQSDKILVEINSSSKLILSGTKDEDWVLCLTELDKLLNRSAKHTALFTKQSSVPITYTKALCLLEDGVKAALNDKVRIHPSFILLHFI